MQSSKIKLLLHGKHILALLHDPKQFLQKKKCMGNRNYFIIVLFFPVILFIMN